MKKKHICKNCKKIYKKYIKTSYGYCLRCLPNHLSCRVETNGRRCIMPFYKNNVCKFHWNYGYKNGAEDIIRCSATRSDGIPCRSPAKVKGLCKIHLGNGNYIKKPRKSFGKQKRKTKAGFIYIFDLGIDGLFKVGMTTNWEQRLHSLQAGNPRITMVLTFPVEHSRRNEREVHYLIKAKHVEREIFKLTAEDIITVTHYFAKQTA